MAEALITSGVLGLVIAGLLLLRWHSGRPEKRRARAIADATTGRHKPLPPHEQEHAEEIHAIVEEYRTGDLPRYVEPRKPTVRDVARKYARRPKHSPRRVPKSKRFDPLTSPMPLTEKPVMAPGPAPSWHLESFTESWTSQEIARIVNGSKAAKR